MQYTTQQLQGGVKYSHKTRIGNWNEDYELAIARAKHLSLGMNLSMKLL